MKEVTYGEWFFRIAPRYGRANDGDAAFGIQGRQDDATEEATHEKEGHAESQIDAFASSEAPDFYFGKIPTDDAEEKTRTNGKR